MKVSVLIPVFNSGKFLGACLASILAQDFRDMEILIADDGTDDGTVEIIKDFAARDRRIRWWKNPHNLGLSPNHNACLRQARGEFIKFIHGDDLLLDTALISRMVDILEQNLDVSLVVSGAQIINEQSHVLKRLDCSWSTGIQDGKTVIVQCLEQNANLIGEPVRTLFRRSQARRGFNERYRQIVDLEMWFHLLEQGSLAFMAEPLVAYRIHPQQATQTHHRTGASADEQLRLLTDYYRQPWLDEYASRRMWFKQSYYLRKYYGEQASEIIAHMRKRLGPSGYALGWVRHRLSSPVKKLAQRMAGNR